jgi:hypothetical protein
VIVPVSSPLPVQASPAPPFTADGNLLRDPSFETDSNSDGVADVWAHLGTAAELALERSARHGEFTQRITLQRVGDPIANYAAVQQRIGLAADAAYVVSVDYRFVAAGAQDLSRGVGITVYALAKDDSYVANGTTADWGWPPTESWMRRSTELRPPPGTATLIVEFRLSVNGTLWLDGAKLERAP